MKIILFLILILLVIPSVVLAQEVKLPSLELPQDIKLPHLDIDIKKILEPGSFFNFDQFLEFIKKGVSLAPSQAKEIKFGGQEFDFNPIRIIKSFFNIVVSVVKTGIELISNLIK